VDNSKTTVLSTAGILFAVRSLKDEQLKHAAESNLLTTATNSHPFLLILPANA
jgi:hypothetical protein